MIMNQSGGDAAERLALGLGWFGIALGVAGLASPRGVARLAGADESERTASVIRTFGVRQIASGVAILANPRWAAGVWSRVGGDILDLYALQRASTRYGTRGARLGAAAAGVVAVTILDVVCARRLATLEDGERAPRGRHAERVQAVTTINRPVEEVYQFWRHLPNLPRIMRHLDSVEMTGDRRSHWRVKAPAGVVLEWDAETLDERANEAIAWRSLEGASIVNSGSVRFRPAPGGRGTELGVTIRYTPPAGRLGAGVAWLLGGALDEQIREDLHRCKQLLETGEVPLSDGPGLWRAARPAARPEDVRSRAGVH